MKIVVLLKLKIDFTRFMAQLIGSLAGPEWRLKFAFNYPYKLERLHLTVIPGDCSRTTETRRLQRLPGQSVWVKTARQKQ